MVILEVSRVFSSFFRFRSILVIFRGFRGILVILKVSRVLLLILEMLGYFGHFKGFGVNLVIF